MRAIYMEKMIESRNKVRRRGGDVTTLDELRQKYEIGQPGYHAQALDEHKAASRTAIFTVILIVAAALAATGNSSEKTHKDTEQIVWQKSVSDGDVDPSSAAKVSNVALSTRRKVQAVAK